MFYAITWFLVFALLALWSLVAWAMHGAAAWAVSHAGAMGGAAGAGALRLPEWLSPWLPPEVIRWVELSLGTVGPALDALLQAVPALAGGVTLMAWAIWALGALLLVAMGVALHLLIAWWRRRALPPASVQARTGVSAG